MEKARKAGLEVETVIGDTAYSSKQNLELAQSKENTDMGFELISRLHPVISNTDKEEGINGFTYNKDAGMFVCPAGHMAICKHKRMNHSRKENPVLTYYFDVENARFAR